MDWSFLVDIIITFIAVFAAIWFFRALWMVVEPRLILRWADITSGVLIVRVEVHNKSKVYVTLQKCELQILERDIPPSGYISEFIPFEKGDPRTDPPIPEQEWHVPVRILATTSTIEPGETIEVERAYRCQTERPIIHCAIQVHAKVTWRLKLANLRCKPTERWTATAMATRYEE